MGRCRRRLGDQSRLGPAVDCALERQCRPLSFHFVDRRVLPLSRSLDEAHPVRLLVDDPKDESLKYGVAKAQCERQVQAVFGENEVVVRPTYIVGPGDTTDRFSTGRSA